LAIGIIQLQLQLEQMFNQKQTLITGALLGAFGVALGAFGAHALKPTLITNQSLETYELAVRYQFYHAFALLIIGLLMEKIESKTLTSSATCMVVGVVLFSGSLYGLAFKTGKAIAFLTPIGGLFLIAGWVLLLISVLKVKTKKA
jgi:uncharacterized membrane protein YgdD (TMEM256/DUF423 family)